MIRLIIGVIFIALFLILGLPVMLVIKIIGSFKPETADYAALRTVQWALRVLTFISGAQVTVIGEERIPDGPVLYVGNHRSYFDVFLTYPRCKGLTGFVAKKETLNYPILRQWMKMVKCVFLDRENPREGLKAILQAIAQVKGGISMVIFPEGTRNTGEELTLLPFKAGSLKIAEKSGCPIVPVSMNNTRAVFEAQAPIVKKAQVVIEYGEPIYPNGMDRAQKRQLEKNVQTIIQDTIVKNAALIQKES
mgnify:CR=1 FL=1